MNNNFNNESVIDDHDRNKFRGRVGTEGAGKAKWSVVWRELE